MDTLQGILVVLHLLGWAMVFGGALAGMKGTKLTDGAFHGILTALVTGIVLTGLLGADANHVKIGVKLVVALVVTALVVVGRRRPEKVTRGFLGAVAGLVVLNVAIAVLWR
ncbi:hypothetical protein [Cellulomonas dongxiuzhuiae]|uniref:Integral membrane protein n=1 Tax=Cellulomonas dongxiuzhuiae TaxID=2819979 RepID=A0ABX8GHN2_9CELL|nr:hypothetical protein [Cellulomonas dongxiuzhuiae]MBO3088565.1 hypothetical protein [Cellulomonas dongxiuzhuiae]MBO3094102.1 hypothetical protein [Cellulomonas dongxiuzhuiae]QWC15166.1 hypothetical protein KKR89_12635 [Cellulomonas dongxiuzhuiae]